MIGYGGSRCLDPGYDGASRQDAPAGELVFRQASSPAVEDLQHAGAGLHLAKQIVDRGLDQEIDEALERGGVAIGPEPRLRPGPCCRRPRPCRSPRSTAPRKSRSPARHPAAPAPRGPGSHRPGQIGLAADVSRSSRARSLPFRTGSSFGPFALDELDLLPKGIGHDQNVGEDDRRVEVEPAQGLERYFGGKLWIEAKIEEGAGLGPDLAIFREIAPGLAHQPDRRRIDGFAA